MGADSKNQGANMCCQHKIYDIIKEKFEHFTEWVWVTKREVL